MPNTVPENFVTLCKGLQSSHYATMVLQRIKELTGIRTDINLANKFGVKPNTISSWRSRNTLDFFSLLDLCCKEELDLNYIFFGVISEEKYVTRFKELQEQIAKVQDILNETKKLYEPIEKK